MSTRPSLLRLATRACAARRVVDQMDCAGAVDAYVWGYPLVDVTKTRNRLACRLGVNHLYNATTLAGPSSTSVVAPNDDTLYSTAFLDLRKDPEILTVPAVSNRYLNFQLLDMYSNTFADIGVLTDHGHAGRYAIVGPGWHGTVPPGVTRIDAPTPDVWLLGRTEVNGPSDLAATVAIQKLYVLTALTNAGSGTTGGPSTLNCIASTPPASLFDQVSADMAADPPLAMDGPVVRAMATAGIAPGRSPVSASTPSVQAAYTTAEEIGKRLIATEASQLDGTEKNGFRNNPTAGTFGTDYIVRAAVAMFGLGEQVPSQAMYFSATTDSAGAGLSGSSTYRIRFSRGDLPPTGKDGFWSVTMYDKADFLVANPIDRYSIGEHSAGLVLGPGGSLTIVLSTGRPTNPLDNWLPAPTGPFRVSLRVYAPAVAVSSGTWQPPAITRVD